MRDKVEIEIVESASSVGGVLDNLTSHSIALDLTAASEASFEIGDDGTFADIANAIHPGQRWSVKLNGTRMLGGRVEANDAPLDAQAGAVARFTVRSWLADAMVVSCRASLAVKGTSLEDVVLGAYAGLGVGRDRFVFRASLARDLRTGRLSEGKDPSIRLTALKVEEARPQVGESIYAFVDRHLRRFGLMQWDGPDNTIVIGYPNQGQTPIYEFRAKRGRAGAGNNVTGMTRTQDYTDVPTAVILHGGTRPRSGARFPITAVAVNALAVACGFTRPILVHAEGIRNQEAAQNAAEREMAARIRNQDALAIETDGLSYLDPSNGHRVAYVPDTIASVETDVGGGSIGAYYLARVGLRSDASSGDTTSLSLLRAGLWQLFPDAYEGKLD